MNDLMHLVKGPDVVPQPPRQPGHTFDIETGYRAKDQDKELNVFLSKVKEIKREMAGIEEKMRQIKEMHDQSKWIVQGREVQQHREAMQDVINQTKVDVKRIKQHLSEVDRMNAAALQQKGKGEGTADERTRTGVTMALNEQLLQLVSEFYTLEDRMRQENWEAVQKRVYTVTGQQVPEEVADQLIETGDAERIFQQAILHQGQGAVTRNVLAQISERNRGMKALESSLLELHQMFLDLGTLVEEQGKMLNTIENNVFRSKSFVETGKEEIDKADRIQRNTRKWKLCCCIVLTLILLIVAAVVAVYVVRMRNQAKGAEQAVNSGRRLLRLMPLPELPEQRRSSSSSSRE